MTRQTPPYPPIALRGLWTCILLPQVVIITGIEVLSRYQLLHPGTALGVTASMLPPVGGVVGCVLWRRKLRRLRQRVADAEGCVCVRCGYSVQGLGESGVCPECGLAFDRARTLQAWICAKIFKPPA